jgi:hypothetical protein
MTEREWLQPHKSPSNEELAEGTLRLASPCLDGPFSYENFAHPHSAFS